MNVTRPRSLLIAGWLLASASVAADTTPSCKSTVIGADHAGKDRAREFLPYKDYLQDPDGPDPEGKRFPPFLTTEVMPLVDGRYRTLEGHANAGIGRSS